LKQDAQSIIGVTEYTTITFNTEGMLL